MCLTAGKKGAAPENEILTDLSKEVNQRELPEVDMSSA
mgnify:CR=1 FL=1